MIILLSLICLSVFNFPAEAHRFSISRRAGPTLNSAYWIWTSDVNANSDGATTAPPGVRFFRKTITTPPNEIATSLTVLIAADNTFTFYLNSQLIAFNHLYSSARHYEITNIDPNENTFAILVENLNLEENEERNYNPAGLVVFIRVTMDSGRVMDAVSDNGWKGNLQAIEGFEKPELDVSGWRDATVIGKYGTLVHDPWVGKINMGAVENVEASGVPATTTAATVSSDRTPPSAPSSISWGVITTFEGSRKITETLPVFSSVETHITSTASASSSATQVSALRIIPTTSVTSEVTSEATSPSTSLPSPSSTVLPRPPTNSQSLPSANRLGIILGSIFGALVFIAILAFFLWISIRRRRRQRRPTPALGEGITPFAIQTTITAGRPSKIMSSITVDTTRLGRGQKKSMDMSPESDSDGPPSGPFVFRPPGRQDEMRAALPPAYSEYWH